MIYDLEVVSRRACRSMIRTISRQFSSTCLTEHARAQCREHFSRGRKGEPYVSWNYEGSGGGNYDLPSSPAFTEKRITKLFLTSGQVDLKREVIRLPLHRGHLSSGETVWFVLTDVSDLDTSKKMGLTWAPSLGEAKTSRARELPKWMSLTTSPSNRGGLISHQFKG